MEANATEDATDVLLAGGEEDNTTVVSCDCSAAPSSSTNNSTINQTEEPEAVIKVLTLDWKAKDVIDLLGPRFEEYKNGKVKVETSTVSGFDTLFGEIVNDARLGLGLFDVCE